MSICVLGAGRERSRPRVRETAAGPSPSLGAVPCGAPRSSGASKNSVRHGHGSFCAPASHCHTDLSPPGRSRILLHTRWNFCDTS
eukprot:6214750-Pleurochrysis_carterae.AAC.1